MAFLPATTAREVVERRSLGWGFKVAPLAGIDYTRADLVLTGGTILETVVGRAALLQDLALAFCTGRGTDPLNVGFGFDGARLIAEEGDLSVLRERLRAAAAVVVDADPRVRRVVDVTLGVDPLLVVAPDVPPVGLVRDLWITVTFDTLTGERVSGTIGRFDEDA
jgi:hypothetical protein